MAPTCPSRRADNPEGARFCATCGTALGAACPACAGPVPSGARFCPSCGHPLESATLTEERKVVTVLFCDLVGFTAMSDQADPEEVRARLRPYHARIRIDVESYGGKVERLTSSVSGGV